MISFDYILMRIFRPQHEKIVRFCDKSSFGRRFYNSFVMPIERSILGIGHYSIGSKIYPSYFKIWENTMALFLTEEQKKDARYVRKIKKELIKSWLTSNISATEYFLYGFEKLNDEQRREFMADSERWDLLNNTFGAEVRNEHANKWLFYQMAKPYFHRDACKVGVDAPKEDFLAFVSRHPRFFVKELEGCFGRNAYLLETDSAERSEEIYNKLVTHGEWILEELIIQSKEMSSWNASSVNTVRMASFITSKDEHHIVMPFFRAGRVGAIVDNAMSGGMVAGVDEKTGRLCSDGFDENGHTYVSHPDSGIRVKGWQIPQWEELCRLTEEVHRSMPPYHRYVAFDFAHSVNGWVLVEANWGQVIFNQAGSQRGIRKQFIEYIK